MDLGTCLKRRCRCATGGLAGLFYVDPIPGLTSAAWGRRVERAGRCALREQALARVRSDPVAGLTGCIDRAERSPASQVAIQVTGNNFCERRDAGVFAPDRVVQRDPGCALGSVFVGGGGGVGDPQAGRHGAAARLWSGVSEEASASANYQGAVAGREHTERTDGQRPFERARGSSMRGASWPTAPNREGAGAGGEPAALASSIRSLRSDLIGVRNQVDSQLAATVDSANKLLQQIADVNAAVVQAEAGTGVSNSLCGTSATR